jgi:hypothetical protein
MKGDDQVAIGTSFLLQKDQLRELFEKHVPVRAVKIPVKAAPLKWSGVQQKQSPKRCSPWDCSKGFETSSGHHCR